MVYECKLLFLEIIDSQIYSLPCCFSSIFFIHCNHHHLISRSSLTPYPFFPSPNFQFSLVFFPQKIPAASFLFGDFLHLQQIQAVKCEKKTCFICFFYLSQVSSCFVKWFFQFSDLLRFFVDFHLFKSKICLYLVFL